MSLKAHNWFIVEREENIDFSKSRHITNYSFFIYMEDNRETS